MATKKRRRSRKRPHSFSMAITMGCKVDGKVAALIWRREGPRVYASLMPTTTLPPKSAKTMPVPKSILDFDFGDGETLHTALHALGVWTWGSDGEP